MEKRKNTEDTVAAAVHEIPKCALGEAETLIDQRKGRVLLVLNTEICENFPILWESGNNIYLTKYYYFIIIFIIIIIILCLFIIN